MINVPREGRFAYVLSRLRKKYFWFRLQPAWGDIDQKHLLEWIIHVSVRYLENINPTPGKLLIHESWVDLILNMMRHNSLSIQNITIQLINMCLCSKFG